MKAKRQFRHVGVHSKVLSVTPAKAAYWLEHNNTKNRPLSVATVTRYARDMQSGRWRLTSQGIAFNSDGALLDGQHRLQAIVNANVAVDMLVVYNVPDDSRCVIDGHKMRTDRDRLVLGYGTDVAGATIAVAKLMMNGSGAGKPTTAELRDFIAEHEDALRFTESLFPSDKRSITTAAVKAALARAFYGGQLERLRQFADVLYTGVCMSDEDTAAMALRDFLMAARGQSHGSTQRRIVFRAAQGAIRAFVSGEPRSLIRPVKHDVYPLPTTDAA